MRAKRTESPRSVAAPGREGLEPLSLEEVERKKNKAVGPLLGVFVLLARVARTDGVGGWCAPRCLLDPPPSPSSATAMLCYYC